MLKKIEHILETICVIAMLDVCILPWIGMAINDNEISRIVISIGLAGAVVITVCMPAIYGLLCVKDRKKK